MVRSVRNKLASLDLSKSYHIVNQNIILWDCESYLPKNIADMIRSFLQPLKVKTKGDVLDKTAILRLGLTQGSPLSPILFIFHINDVHKFGDIREYAMVQTGAIGEANFSLTADDMIIHTISCKKDTGLIMHVQNGRGKKECNLKVRNVSQYARMRKKL